VAASMISMRISEFLDSEPAGTIFAIRSTR
jgi:hypothetical protein